MLTIPTDQRKALCILGVIMFIALLFYPTLVDLWPRWILWDQDLAHAVPTILIVGYLLLTAKYVEIEKESPLLHSAWITLATLSSLLWFVFYQSDISLLAQLSLFFCLVATLAAIFSSKFLGNAFPILCLLLFCTSLWGEFNNTLIRLSAIVVGSLVKASHLTALIEGKSIHLPYGTIFIADGCSGLRYFIIASLMGLLIGILNQYNKTQIALAIVLFAFIGIIANWVRIFLLVIIGYQSEMTSSLMHDHEMFGWILFAILLFPAVYLSPLLSRHKRIIHIAPSRMILPLAFVALGPALSLIRTPISEDPILDLKISSFNQSAQSIETIVHPKNLKIQNFYYLMHENINFRVDWFQKDSSRIEKGVVPYIGNIIDNSQFGLIDRYSIKTSPSSPFSVEIVKQNISREMRIVVKQYHVGQLRMEGYQLAKILQGLEIFRGNRQFGLLTLQIACETTCDRERAILPDLLSKLDKTISNAH